MLSSIMRLLAMVFLAFAVVGVIVDAARSIAVDEVTLASFGDTLGQVAPASMEDIRALSAQSLPAVLDEAVVAGLLAAPAIAVFAVLSLLLYLLGGLMRRPRGRYVYGK